MVNKTSAIGKKELINMFDKMNDKLELLEKTILVNSSYKKNEMIKKQEERIMSLGDQLEALEMKIISIRSQNDGNELLPLKLKLSY